MDSVENQLQPGEHEVYRAHLHWIVFVMPVFIIILALLMYPIHAMLNVVSYVVLAVGLINFFMAYLTYTFTRYIITNKRVISRKGWISRSLSGVLLDRIESVDVYQSILGRVFGYGTAVVTGTGGTRDFFRNISAPFLFRQQLQTVLLGSANETQ